MDMIFRGYTESAKQRIASSERGELKAFVGHLSTKVLEKLYRPLPIPKGFRVGPASVPRQTEMLVSRLLSNKSKRTEDNEVFELVWRNVCIHFGAEPPINNYYENVSSANEEENEEDKNELLLVADRSLFEEISSSSNMSRESFCEIHLYSPTDLDDQFSKLSKLLKPEEELDKERVFHELPEKVLELEKREEQLEQLPSEVLLLQEEVGEIQESIRAIEESSAKKTDVEKLAVVLKKDLKTVTDESSSRINGLEEGQLAGKQLEEVARQDMVGLINRLDLAFSNIEDLVNRVDVFEKELSDLGEVLKTPSHSQEVIIQNPGMSDSFRRVDDSKSLIKIEENDKLVEFIESSLRTLGIGKKFRNYCRTAILTAVTAQRILTLSGPMSNHMGLNLASAFGGEYLRWDTKVGEIEEHVNVANNVSRAENLSTILLRDVSLSIPGVLFRQLVSEIEKNHANSSTHFGRFVIATASRGSVHLPLDSMFLNLTLDLDFSSISIIEPKPLEYSAQVETTLLESLLAEATTEVLLDPYEDLLAESPVISFHESKHLKLVAKCLQMYAGYSETRQSLDSLVADVFLSSLLRPRYEEIKDFKEIALKTLSELGVEIEETICLKRILNV
jgi:hypothetical protein